MEFQPEMYKIINRELSMKVQSLQMQLAESRSENIQLNTELLQCRKKMHHLKTVIMDTIDNNIKGYNQIAAALVNDASPRRSEPHPTVAEEAFRNSSMANAYQSFRQERNKSIPRASSSTSLYLGSSLANQEPTTSEMGDELSIEHEQTTMKNISQHLNDSPTNSSMDASDECNEQNSIPIPSRPTLGAPMPVRVRDLSPESNQDDDTADAEYQQLVASELSPLPIRLDTIVEGSDNENEISSSQISEESVANCQSLISSNISLRRGNTNQRKKSSFFVDQGSEWQSKTHSNSTVLHSLDDDGLIIDNDASVTILPTPDSSLLSQNRNSNTFGLISTPPLTGRTTELQNANKTLDHTDTPILIGRHRVARALSDLTNVNNSMVTPKKTASTSSDPSWNDIGDLSDLTLMGGATCSTPNHQTAMDSFEVTKNGKVRRLSQIRQAVSKMYKMPTRKSIALEKLLASSTQTNDNSSNFNSCANTGSMDTLSSKNSVVSVDCASVTYDGRPKRKAAPVILREPAINAKMRNPVSKPKPKQKRNK